MAPLLLTRMGPVQVLHQHPDMLPHSVQVDLQAARMGALASLFGTDNATGMGNGEKAVIRAHVCASGPWGPGGRGHVGILAVRQQPGCRLSHTCGVGPGQGQNALHGQGRASS